MKYYFLFLTQVIANCFVLNNFSQVKEISGQVLSLEEKEPLQYAVVEHRKLKTGAYSDENGIFKLAINDGSIDDSLTISYVGFEKKNVCIKDLNKSINPKIYLKRNIYQLNEVVVKNKKIKYQLLGSKTKKPWSHVKVNVFGAQIGKYIQNPKGEKGFIKSVSFYLHSVGYPEAPFRIRVYSYDKIKKCPGEDLLMENVIVSNKNKPGWFKVDLLKYSIEFPPDGAFVIMEWIYSGDKYYYNDEITTKSKDSQTIKKEMARFYGQTIGSINKQTDGYWGKGLGDTWVQYRFNIKGYVNVMINAEIGFYQKK